VSVLIDDDVLYDIFMDNYKAAAVMAILSTQQFEKFNDKCLLKKVQIFCRK
jgi:hypothetical protein